MATQVDPAICHLVSQSVSHFVLFRKLERHWNTFVTDLGYNLWASIVDMSESRALLYIAYGGGYADRAVWRSLSQFKLALTVGRWLPPASSCGILSSGDWGGGAHSSVIIPSAASLDLELAPVTTIRDQTTKTSHNSQSSRLELINAIWRRILNWLRLIRITICPLTLISVSFCSSLKGFWLAQ